jgi:hypothetical protein
MTANTSSTSRTMTTSNEVGRVDHASLGSVFVDFENFSLSLSNQYDHSPADAQAKTINIIGHVERFLADRGVQIVLRRAYADWSQYPDAMKELYRMGVQTVNVGSTPRKNSADIELSLSLQEVMLTRNEINVLTVMAGDRDYMPIAMRVNEHAKTLLFISFKNSLSGDLKALVGPRGYFYVDPQSGRVINQEGQLKGEAGPNSTSQGEGRTSKELADYEMKALHGAIRSYDEYKEKYGDVKLSGFLVDALQQELPDLSHLERKQIFSALVKKGYVRTNIKTDFFGNDVFTVFSVDDANSIVKKERAKLKDAGVPHKTLGEQ